MRTSTFRTKRATLALVSVFTYLFTSAQVTDAFGTWDIWPMQKQFYPRSIQTNKGTVRVKGTLNNSLALPRLRLYREGSLVKTEVLTPNQSFDVTFEITAELANYQVNLENDFNWTTKQVGELVAGDVYFISGQSNAESRKMESGGGFPGDNSNPDVNTDVGGNINFVRVYGGSIDNYTKQWFIGNGNTNAFQNGNTGQVGMRLAREIIRTQGVPVCIMNGAERGEPIEYYLPAANHFSTSTNYGRELTRLTEAGLVGKIRAFIWYQGESNTINGDPATNKTSYINNFTQIYNAWTLDYGPAEKYYIVQIRPGCSNNENSPAAKDRVLAIQEAHREIVAADPAKRTLVGTNGIPQYGDECHYYYAGYKQIGNRLFSLINNQVYGAPVTNDNYTTPQPRKVSPLYFSGGSSGQVTMSFDKPGDTYSVTAVTGDIRSRFNLEGGNYTINSVAIQNTGATGSPYNVLRINYTMNAGTINNPTGLTYRNDYHDNNPVIVNSDGMQMVSFSISGIAAFDPLPADPLTLRITPVNGRNNLYWQIENNNDFEYFEVERSQNGNKYSTIATVPGSLLAGKAQYDYSDTKPSSEKNFYRIKAFNFNGKIIYSHEVAVNNRLSFTDGLKLFPNPAKDQAMAGLSVKEAGSATIQIFDQNGRMNTTRTIMLQKGNNLFSIGEVLDLKPGMYVVRIITGTDIYTGRLVRMN
ncbi:sialate O-acetylesterase [Flavihumibacter solisilvae]|uniref:Uncharacterized protein n=1 Tax=Flavihumibacter solisilvae TaxID=1349421 RepID=A0A0C1LG27_9BACT|nr:sialate O-acetylesterase [Flavihumibacter solisilvae]KIC94303.1 hypothetical protein OI18_11750 [Flavihumibacter solisilvae]